MNAKPNLAIGPEPLHVLSQTTVVRNGPTYLKLSTLRPPTSLDRMGRDPPTSKVEFLPRESAQDELDSSPNRSIR